MTSVPLASQRPFNSPAAHFTGLLVRELQQMPEFANVSSMSFDSQSPPLIGNTWLSGESHFTVHTRNGSFTVECVSGPIYGLLTTIKVPGVQNETAKEYRFGGVEPNPSILNRVVPAMQNILKILSDQPFRDEFAGAVMPPRHVHPRV